MFGQSNICLLYSNSKQSQDQCHSYIYAVLNLIEVSGTGILINFHGNLVYSGQGMEDQHIFFGKRVM